MTGLFTHGTANGHEIAIALEDMEIPHQAKAVGVFAGEGQVPWFLQASLAEPMFGPRAHFNYFAPFPWMSTMIKLGFPFDRHAALHSWFARVAVRPAVIMGLEIPTRIQNLAPRRKSGCLHLWRTK